MRLAISLANFVALASAAEIVNLGYAQYQGFIDPTSNNTHFLGIRYAAAPTGALRWTAPRVPATVTAVQQANAEPPQCFQAGSGVSATSPFRTSPVAKRAAAVTTSEDCLFLNVFTPGDLSQSTKKLPVVVWIHGGGYMAGSASGATGDDLIREAGGGVVAVAIQYRLGVFGFLPGTKVKQGGALNAGLLDQDFALQWVQQHISLFGGDPTRVTIWGESAGAGSVLQHVIARGGKTNPPLFRAAMTSSTFLPSQYQFNDPIPEKLFSLVSTQTNCSSAADTLACLRAVNVNTLQAANANIGNSAFFGTFIFVPVVDGTFITQRATQAFANRQVNGRVVLAVTNTFEGAAFVNSATANTVQIPNYVSQLFPLFSAQEVAAATAQYQGMGTALDQAIAIMGESIFICPTYLMLRAFGVNAFKGEFAIPPGGHGQDVVYYFPGTSTPPFANPDFDKAFSNSFMNFVLSLDPNVKTSPTITPQWNPWQGAAEMLFNKTVSNAPDVRGVNTSRTLLSRCEFWNSVGALSGQ
ncbi:Alpha/Beta hydrolase protein [Infundibulicybe gibba]|nr:Alpha/Beta hydrolase protein [Infundibulicybe gibba]